jgi:predicted O-methyltransferase YrrM
MDRPLAGVPAADTPHTPHPDPIPAILASEEFAAMVRTFSSSPSIKHALVSPDSQALLYCLIRMLRPRLAIEIGTYLASTTEAMARAIAANGSGELHAVDPFAIKARLIVAGWPRQLRRVTRFYLRNSAAYFGRMQRLGRRADLVFVDGNHDFEFALFDIQSAARMMNPGGFIVIDNIAQPGPFLAARDFMARAHSQGWRECGRSLQRFDPSSPFDRDRTTIHNTDFCVLRAPPTVAIGEQPACFGELNWTSHDSALRLAPDGPASGRLHVQFVIRVFEKPPREHIASAQVDVEGGSQITIPIPFPPDQTNRQRPRFFRRSTRRTIEAWLSWEGPGSLQLAELPALQ